MGKNIRLITRAHGTVGAGWYLEWFSVKRRKQGESNWGAEQRYNYYGWVQTDTWTDIRYDRVKLKIQIKTNGNFDGSGTDGDVYVKPCVRGKGCLDVQQLKSEKSHFSGGKTDTFELYFDKPAGTIDQLQVMMDASGTWYSDWMVDWFKVWIHTGGRWVHQGDFGACAWFESEKWRTFNKASTRDCRKSDYQSCGGDSECRSNSCKYTKSLWRDRMCKPSAGFALNRQCNSGNDCVSPRICEGGKCRQCKKNKHGSDTSCSNSQYCNSNYQCVGAKGTGSRCSEAHTCRYKICAWNSNRSHKVCCGSSGQKYNFWKAKWQCK